MTTSTQEARAREKVAVRLRETKEARGRLDEAELMAVIAARALTPPMTWVEIGAHLGTTGPYAHRRFKAAIQETHTVEAAPDQLKPRRRR